MKFLLVFVLLRAMVKHEEKSTLLIAWHLMVLYTTFILSANILFLNLKKLRLWSSAEAEIVLKFLRKNEPHVLIKLFL